MTITVHPVTVEELATGYKDNAEDGVFGYSDRLDIRPSFQRELVYNEAKMVAVIDTIMKNLPLNVMYWAKKDDGTYEIIDGQQRTLSICKYINSEFSWHGRYYHNMTSDEKQRLLQYQLFIYVCEGLESEKLEWFETINIAATQLTKQELRNAVYSGPWLSDAKKYFSKTNCVAERIAGPYLTGSAIRQDYLETALDWISDKLVGSDKDANIKEYMARHQKDPNASELWRYFQSVITWIETIFPKKTKYMKGIAWGKLYNKYHAVTVDTAVIAAEIDKLMMDDDVTNNKGIYPYILTRDEKHLSIRQFTLAQKTKQYTKQGGKCAKCGDWYPIEETEADHIKPWVEGGTTTDSNCQILCKNCNRRKGKK